MRAVHRAKMCIRRAPPSAIDSDSRKSAGLIQKAVRDNLSGHAERGVRTDDVAGATCSSEIGGACEKSFAQVR